MFASMVKSFLRPKEKYALFPVGDPKMRKGLLFAKRSFIFAKRTFIMAKTMYWDYF